MFTKNIRTICSKSFASLIIIGSLVSYASALEIPSFLDKSEINNSEFTCIGEVPKFSAEDQKQIDILWGETLTYLKGYALALTTGDVAKCMDSDEAIYDTTEMKKICIMKRRDMRLMVKNIYQVLANPNKAKACFSARRDVKWLYNPGRELTANSSVSKWANRMTFDEFFDKKVKNKEVRKLGHEFTKNFAKMVTGDEVKMPLTFPFDVSANALPNLWASAGWFPMYAQESKRNDKNFDNVRGGYAYAEIMGNWGLLRIDKINDQVVGAEIGMTVQKVGTLYPYHTHAIPEIYYNMRVPACTKQFRTFAVREDSPLVKAVESTDKLRKVQFDGTVNNEPDMWVAGSNKYNSLVYLHQNTIHAFEVDADCEAKPEQRALVSVWARTNAADRRNDYGTTLLCESAAHPGTPAHRGELIQCDLTPVKW
ncbi:MAG: hypothetical protein ACJAWW_002436 [Sulfurimonas sp.]|jgi:hypothetical protein